MPTERTFRLRRIAVTLAVLMLLAALGLVGTAAYFTITRQPAPWSSACTATVNGASARIDAEQARNAAIIAGMAARRGLAPRAATIAIATALQESGLRNLDYGDRDSLGLFQQRPSQGWGSAAQVQDPWYAANAFYVAMEKVKGWETADVGDVAQAVQKSGFPDAYDKHVANAKLLASALSGETPRAFSCTSRSLPAGDAAGLKEFLTKTLPSGTTVTATAEGVTVRSASTRAAYSVAAIAIADASESGVRHVEVAGGRWQHGWPFGSSWVAVSNGVPSTDATLTLS